MALPAVLKPVAVLATLAVVGASAAVLTLSVVETSTARVSDSSETASFLTVGTLSLDGSTHQSDLLFDADGLYPGLSVSGCVDLVYNGSIPGSIRLHGRPADTSGLEDTVGPEETVGLEDFVDLVVVRSPPGRTCDSVGESDRQLFDGLLSDLWRQHDGYDSGLVLDRRADAGSRFAVRATAVVRDDNRAQGLGSRFLLTIEVRP